MRGGEEVRAARRLRGLERPIARRASPRLQVTAGGHLDPRPRELHTPLARKPLGEIELRRRFGAQAMVDAVRHQRQPELRRQTREHVQERE